MRSIPLMAVSTVVLAAAWACGGDGGNVGPNTAPVAAFTAPSCTANTPCSFADASTDADGTISTRTWDFGDGNTGQGQNVTNTYAAAGTYSVTLTVTDNGGASDDVTNTVVVTGGTGNVPPTASFTLPTSCTAGTPCGFHSTSTDADGQVVSTQWDFGDQGAADGPDATHTYAAAGTFNVTLTVTDNLGASGTSTQAITVAPVSSQDCTTSGTVVDCSLVMTQTVTVKAVMVSSSCELIGNRLTSREPVLQNIFFNLCARQPGEEHVITDASGAPLVFTAGTELALRFFQGTAGAGDPPTGDPGIRIDGTFPTWTLNIDDGGAAGTPGEPDFNDAVVTIQATP